MLNTTCFELCNLWFHIKQGSYKINVTQKKTWNHLQIGIVELFQKLFIPHVIPVSSSTISAFKNYSKALLFEICVWCLLKISAITYENILIKLIKVKLRKNTNNFSYGNEMHSTWMVFSVAMLYHSLKGPFLWLTIVYATKNYNHKHVKLPFPVKFLIFL